MPSPSNLPLLLAAFANDRADGEQYLRNLAEEARRLKGALQPAERLCEREVLQNSTLEELLGAFQRFRNRVAVFHYGGHANGFQLLLEDPEGKVRAAQAGGLAAFLAEQRGLRLVFLNGCSTERQVDDLIAAGVPCVIATTQSIDDRVATEFAARFYSGLATGAPIGRACREAEAAAKTAAAGPEEAYRKVQFGEAEARPAVDRWPWILRTAPGKEEVLNWSLPQGAGDWSFGLPDLPKDVRYPVGGPFVSLHRFERSHARVFFGRGREIRRLYERLAARSAPLILYHGQSGVGKSSVLDAGLRPRLEADFDVRLVRRVQEVGLLGSLKTASLPEGESVLDAGRWRSLEQQCQRPLIVILDQVEEAYTLPSKQGTATELDELLRYVRSVFQDPQHVPQGRLVLSFRKEWLPELVKAVTAHDLEHTTEFLDRLDEAGVQEAVRLSPEVCEHYKLTVDPDLPQTIAVTLLSDAASPVATTLQVLLTRLWDEARKRNLSQPAIDAALFSELKKRDGVGLDDFLTRQLSEIEKLQPDVIASGLALDVLRAHVSPQGTAAQQTLSALRQQYAHVWPQVQEFLDHCRQRYLIIDQPPLTPDAEPATRLAHDTLAPLVRKRFDESDKPGQRARRVLDGRTQDWANGKTDAPLDNADLQIVEQGMRGTRSRSQTESQLLSASWKARKNARRRTQYAIGLGAFLTVFATTLLIWGKISADRATAANDLRQRQLRQNESVRLATEANKIRSEYPQRAALLALESLKSTSVDGVHTAVAEQSLRDALDAIQEPTLGGQLIATDPAGERFATVESTGSIRLWSLEQSAREIRTFKMPSRPDSVEFCRSWLAATTQASDGNLRLSQQGLLWNLERPELTPQSFPGGRLIAVSPHYLVTEANPGNKGEAEYALYPIVRDQIGASERLEGNIQLSANRRWLAVRTEAGSLRVWDLSQSTGPFEIQAATDVDGLLAIGPTGTCVIRPSADEDDGHSRESTLALIDRNGTQVQLPVQTPDRRGAGIYPNEDPIGVFTSDGHWLAVSAAVPDNNNLFSLRGDCRVWDTTEPKPAATIPCGRLDYMAFVQQTIVTVGESGVAVWNQDGTGGFVGTPLGTGSVLGISDQLIVQQGDPGTVLVRKVDSVDKPQTVSGHEGGISQLMIAADQQRLVTSDASGVRIWSTSAAVRGIEPRVVALAAEPHALQFLSADTLVGCDSNTLWKVRIDSAQKIELSQQSISGAAFDEKLLGEEQALSVSGDGRWIVAAGGYLTAGVLVHPDGHATWLPFPNQSYDGAEFSDNNRWLIAKTGDRHVVWSLGTVVRPVRFDRSVATLVENLQVESPNASDAHFSDDTVLFAGRVDQAGDWMLVTNQSPDSVELWDLSGAEPMLAERQPPFFKEAGETHLLRNGQWIMVQNRNGTTLWNLAHPMDSGRDLPFELTNNSQFEAAPDGRWVAIDTGDAQELYYQDGETMRRVKTDVDIASGNRIVFSPDGQWVIVWSQGSPYFEVRRLAPEEVGPAIIARGGHTAGIKDIIAMEGGTVISSSADDESALWDLNDLEWGSVKFDGRTRAVSPDGRLLVTSTGSQLRLWRLWPAGAQGNQRIAELEKLARQTVPRELSEDERRELGLGKLPAK